MKSSRRTQLSKFMSLVLRHQPSRFGLALDAEGYVTMEALRAAITAQPGWSEVSGADILEVVETSDKRRFEMAGDRIRARYGHSVAATPAYPAVVPPAVLYHGTPHRALERIRREGLKAMMRQYVHLATRQDIAEQVGHRRDKQPVVLEIDAEGAYASGVAFYQAGEDFFLVRYLPPEFIRLTGGRSAADVGTQGDG